MRGEGEGEGGEDIDGEACEGATYLQPWMQNCRVRSEKKKKKRTRVALPTASSTASGESGFHPCGSWQGKVDVNGR